MLLKPTATIVGLWLLAVITLAAGSNRRAELSKGAARDAKSKEIRKYMNEAADPCEDFFDFACGNWKKHHPSNWRLPKTGALRMALGDFDKKLPQLLATIDEADTEAERKVKYFYQSCRNAAMLPRASFAAKAKEIANEILKMPSLEGSDWRAGDFDWMKTVAEITFKYDINIIWGYDLRYDEKDHTAYNLRMSKPVFTNKDVAAIARDLHELLGVERHLATKAAEEMYTFERNLKKGFTAARLQISTIENLHEKYYPKLNLKKLFVIALGSVPRGNIFYYKAHLDVLSVFVNFVSKRVVANYIYFTLFQELMNRLPNTRKAEMECYDLVLENFKNVASYMFYRTNDLTEAEQMVEQMWLQIQANLQMVLESSDLKWFDDAAREYALEKVHWMKMVVPSYKDVDLNAEYSNLTVNLQQNYLENQKSLMMFNAAKTRASSTQVIQHIDKDSPLSSPAYLLLANAIVIPVSTLHNDFFYTKWQPNALQLARFGYFLGHEVLHAFGESGRKFNKLGNYRGDWHRDVESGFEKRRKCIYDQFSNYTFGGVHLPQDEDQDENSADIGGILLAYKSYLSWREDGERTQEELDLEVLPNLNYNPDQLFFIYYAQSWCADTYDPSSFMRSSRDAHSPDEFRAYVPLTNFNEFSSAFECPLGMPMNPVKKCSLY